MKKWASEREAKSSQGEVQYKRDINFSFCDCEMTLFEPGWSSQSVPQPLPTSLAVDATLLPATNIGTVDIRLCAHAEAVLVAGKEGQLFRYLHPCDHWLWGLLCIQLGVWFEGVQLQPPCWGDAGKGTFRICCKVFYSVFGTDLWLSIFFWNFIPILHIPQRKAGAPQSKQMRRVSPGLDRGLKVIIDRNFNKWAILPWNWILSLFPNLTRS